MMYVLFVKFDDDVLNSLYNIVLLLISFRRSDFLIIKLKYGIANDIKLIFKRWRRQRPRQAAKICGESFAKLRPREA